MEFHFIDDTVIIPEKGHAGSATFDLVSELIALPFIGQGEGIIVKARARDFLYDPGTGIQVTTILKVEVDNEDVIETNGQLEVMLSGTVKNRQGQCDTFTLFFAMRPDDPVRASMRIGKGIFGGPISGLFASLNVKQTNCMTPFSL